MRAHEIIKEKPIPPHEEFMASIHEILKIARETYESVMNTEAEQDLDFDPDEFDEQVFYSSFLYATKQTNAPFRWNMSGKDQGDKPVNMYIHSAHTNDNGTITFNFYVPHFEDEGIDWNILEMVILRTLEHEAIHMTQRDRMGAERHATRATGFIKAQDDLGSKKAEIRKRGMRTYLSDPQEITAHAKDLHSEASALDEPIMVLKNARKKLEYLPTLKKYLDAGFKPTDRVVKRLVSLAAQYAKMDDEH